MAKCKLDPVALGLAVGIVSGAAGFGLGVLALFFYNGKPFVAAIGQMYLGYQPSLINCALGGAASFIGGFVGAFVISYLYNWILEPPFDFLRKD